MNKQKQKFLSENYTLVQTHGVQYNERGNSDIVTRIICFYINNETFEMGFPDEWMKIIQYRIDRLLHPYFRLSNKDIGGGNEDAGIFDCIFVTYPKTISLYEERIDMYLTACLCREFTESQRLHYEKIQRLPLAERAFHIYDNRFLPHVNSEASAMPTSFTEPPQPYGD